MCFSKKKEEKRKKSIPKEYHKRMKKNIKNLGINTDRRKQTT